MDDERGEFDTCCDAECAVYSIYNIWQPSPYITVTNDLLSAITGWDHGVFVPMTLINPAANVPVVQLSVLSSEDPSQHYLMGRALHHLRSQNIAIIGSGFASCHNIRNLLSGSSKDFVSRNVEWSRAVSQAVKTRDDTAREQQMKGWRDWPNSYLMHPRGGAEHFLPLIVAAGAGGDESAKEYADEFMGLQMLSYYWE